MSLTRIVAAAGFLLVGSALSSAGAQASDHAGHAAGRAADTASVLATVEAYRSALARGDSAAALALLAPDAVILESGGVETREEYRAHHLPADMGFAMAVPSERSTARVTVSGDVAWVASSSASQGEYRGRAINTLGAELMVLSRESNGWRIRAIHWSSRQRRPAP